MTQVPLQFLSNPDTFQEKEALYLEVRRREGRLLQDTAVQNLPNSEPGRPYSREWTWRKRTLLRFKTYLSEYQKRSGKTKLRILDLGCGNGWMSNRIAEHPDFEVFAIDLNQEELEQGARCFQRKNLHFKYADILSLETGLGTFDLIVLAAAVQYFPDLAILIRNLRNRLNLHGEIHILDAPFYPNAAAQAAAQQRSLDYYTRLGVPEMAQYYHHHLWPEAEALGAKDLNATLKTRLLQRLKWLPPFPWLRFR